MKSQVELLVKAYPKFGETPIGPLSTPENFFAYGTGGNAA